MHSPLYSPGRLQSSSSEEATLDVKQKPMSGQGNSDYDTNDPFRNHDPNDPFDIRNSTLYTQGDVSLSSSASDSKTAPIERSVITRKDVEIIRSQASDWQTENDALMAMRHLISKDSRPNLVIDKKALASVLFQSRPPSDALEELAKAQAESFKVGKRDFEKRMSKLTADEAKKICAPRLEVERMKAEYEDKLKDLNLRIQANIALEETSLVPAKQLDEALSEVKQLKEQNQRLQQLLKVVRDGETLSVHESKANTSMRGNESSNSIVSNSSSSMLPFVNTKDTKKRDLSPEHKAHSDSFSFKKPHPKPRFSTAWQNWNRDGTLAAKDYGYGPVVRLLQSKSIIELDALLAKVNLAATDFRSLFPADNAPGIGLRHRNAERHSEFNDVHTELLIPTIDQGRMFALSFYYDQIIQIINGIIATRNAFKIIPEDEKKITAYIAYRGQHCLEVENWKQADNQNTLMTKDLREFRAAYFRAFEAAKLPKSSKPEWMSETSFRILRSLKLPCKSRIDIDMPDQLRAEAKEELSRYYYHINLHTIIDFYMAARALEAKFRHGRPSGYKSSYGGGPRSST
jgi:hypothetical protein